MSSNNMDMLRKKANDLINTTLNEMNNFYKSIGLETRLRVKESKFPSGEWWESHGSVSCSTAEVGNYYVLISFYMEIIKDTRLIRRSKLYSTAKQVVSIDSKIDRFRFEEELVMKLIPIALDHTLRVREHTAVNVIKESNAIPWDIETIIFSMIDLIRMIKERSIKEYIGERGPYYQYIVKTVQNWGIAKKPTLYLYKDTVSAIFNTLETLR